MLGYCTVGTRLGKNSERNVLAEEISVPTAAMESALHGRLLHERSSSNSTRLDANALPIASTAVAFRPLSERTRERSDVPCLIDRELTSASRPGWSGVVSHASMSRTREASEDEELAVVSTSSACSNSPQPRNTSTVRLSRVTGGNAAVSSAINCFCTAANTAGSAAVSGDSCFHCCKRWCTASESAARCCSCC